MKVSCYSQVLLIGLFLGLLYLQVPCLANDTSANSNNRILESIPTHHYALKDQTTDADGTRHIFAEYKGNQNTIGNSEIVKNIEMVVSFHDKNTFRVKIVNKDTPRWEIPEKAPFPHFESNNRIKEAESCCEVHVEGDPFFSFYITRRDTNEVIFDTRNREFVFSNYYIELSTALPTQYVYGYGERNYKFKLDPGTYTIWGRDDAMIVENGEGGGNTYSHHPVGLVRDSHRDFFLTLMRNSNAMDVIIRNDDNKPSLTYKIVGGVIDLIFFVGDQYPETVLKGYHNYLGRFTMMPFWSMGYHQSKWGYSSVHVMNDVVSKYTEHGLPLDVIWSDIDYMINKEIFTVDTYNYPPDQMKDMIRRHNKRWVPIIDPGVRRDNPQGPGSREGQARNVFLKTYQGQNLVGYVWPGPCYFPDFFNPDAEKYWHDMLEILYNIIPFSGIWLDMNEIASFSNGEHGTPRPDTELDRTPYVPGKNKLKHKTLSMDAKHHNGAIEYDVHGLFSLMENEVTYKYLQKKSKLPFILTRGSSMGIGKFAAKWSGDNGAHWNFLQDSIPGNFNFQIFGIPFVGADICGFMDDTNEELCARWTQVGALYPFARNHHEEKTRNQEPWTFMGTNRGVTVLETTRASLKTRYAILKWYYSLFIETQGAGSIFRPLMFEFPQDDQLYNDGVGDHQFLLGKSVLCTPKVKPTEPSEIEPAVDAYFPKATWYELFTGHKVLDKSAVERTKKVATPFNASAPLFLRGGHIVHRQNVDRVLSTEDLNNEFELIVALDRETDQDALSAKGTMMGIAKYDDDSVYNRCMEGNNCLYDISVTVSKEDAASVSVEIRVKRQEPNVRISLDGFSLYGLKLYGLPLDFMEEDESKVGYGLVQIEREGQSTVTISDLVELVEIGSNAFEIVFETPLDVVDGDIVKLELLI